jgi:CRP-like cAMP-binding protein
MNDILVDLNSLEFFQKLDESTGQLLAAELGSVHLPKGEYLLRQGELGESMYFVIGGSLGVTIENPDGSVITVDELMPGMYVGEMALLTNQPRSATVNALEDTELVELSKADFDRVAQENPELVEQLTRAILPRLHRKQLAEILTRLFGELNTSQVHELQSRMDWLQLPSGSRLFQQGDAADEMYIVVSGRLKYVACDDCGQICSQGEI